MIRRLALSTACLAQACALSAMTNVTERLHVKAYADVESSYWARGAIVDKNPFSAQCVDASVDLNPFGTIGAYAWSVSSMSKSGQSATRRNAYNEVDYGAYYAYTLELADGWGLGNFVGPKWVTLPGYRPHAHTINEWNVSQALENPYVTPYYLLRYAYHGQKWAYWDVGLRRSWEVYERLTLLVAAFGEFGDARQFAAQYGPNVHSATGDYSAGLMALNLMVRLDYAMTDWFGLFAFFHQFDVVDGDARETLDRSSAPEAKKDWPMFGVGVAMTF